VSAAAVQVVRVRALAVQGVRGDHDPAQVSDGVQDGGKRGQLITAGHFDLGEDQVLGVVEHGDQLGSLTVLVAGAAQRLTVDGQHGSVLAAGSRVVGVLPPAALAAIQDPAGQGALQRSRVDRGEHPAERGRVRRRPAHGHRLLGAAGPLGDRRIRAGAGQHGADREQQD
jgi:hypothetical protein